MFDALRSALDAVPAAILLYQPDQILHANRTALVLLGMSMTEIVGHSYEALFDHTPTSGSSSAHLRTPTGSVPITITNEPFEHNGTPMSLITMVRRDAPQGIFLSDSQRLFESIFESTVVGIAIMNEGAFYVRVNRTYAAIYGYTPEEMIGQHFFLIFSPEFQARAQETHDRFIRGETANSRSDWSVNRKDGQQIEISAFNNLMISESGERFRIVAVIDITEQKEAQRALEASEQRLNTLVNTMGDAVWSVWAESYQVFYANPAIESLTGYSVQEFMTQQGLLFDIIYPEDRDHFFAQMRQALSKDRIELEHRIIHRDGTVRWVHKRFWVMHSPEGDRIGGLMSDITDHKLAVEQALQLKLENERVRLLSGFIRDASHEFRTPLAIIGTRLALLERNSNPGRQSVYIEGIREQTQRILKLVEALMTMSRLDAMTSLRRERLHLNPLLDAMQQTIQSAARHKDILLTLHPANALYFDGNKEEFAIALQALFDNAITYTPEGGRIDVRCYSSETDEIVIEVSDTGVGISQAVQPHIFERFYRVDHAHSSEGFGLGLPIARKIVELHHGRIEVESAPGKGSTFRLVFPAASAI